MRLSLSPFTSKVAFGAKRTSTGRQNRLDRSKMTQSGQSESVFAATHAISMKTVRSRRGSVHSAACSHGEGHMPVIIRRGS
jgi:hypothetical protein